ncbi:hypothetical protein OIU79_008375 [Salix purpurea]|uniref:Uncharacterized protein n=1 Tax=Salix purpurea TaxID=77065 RepID=A0A9Q0TIE9_SALPP|nr:hypothetical protein OIU79_008375 [Salix purpurea]
MHSTHPDRQNHQAPILLQAYQRKPAEPPHHVRALQTLISLHCRTTGSSSPFFGREISFSLHTRISHTCPLRKFGLLHSSPVCSSTMLRVCTSPNQDHPGGYRQKNTDQDALFCPARSLPPHLSKN